MSLKKGKTVLKNDYVAFWTNKIRNSPTYASYATHKNDYTMETYLIHVTIKKVQLSRKTPFIRPPASYPNQ